MAAATATVTATANAPVNVTVTDTVTASAIANATATATATFLPHFPTFNAFPVFAEALQQPLQSVGLRTYHVLRFGRLFLRRSFF